MSRVGSEAGFFVGVWGTAAFEFGATPSTMAVLAASLAVATMVGSAMAGVLVDRVGPRRVIIGGELLFVPAVLSLTLTTSMTSLSLLAPLAWFVGAFVLTAVVSMPPFLSPDPAQVERTNAVMEGAASLAFVFGPVLGAAIVRVASLDVVFVVDALTSAIAAVIVLRVHLAHTPREQAERTSGLSELREGLRHVTSSRSIMLLLGLGLVTFLSFGMFTALEPLFFRDVLHADAEMLGYVNSLFGLGLMSGAVLLDRADGRLSNVTSVVVLTALSGSGAVAYVGTGTVVGVLIGAVYWGLVLGVLMPLLRIMLQLRTPNEVVGRVMGVFNMSHSVGELLPLAVAPALAVAFGVQSVLAGTGIAIALLSPLALGAARRVDAGKVGRDVTLVEAMEGLDVHVASPRGRPEES